MHLAGRRPAAGGHPPGAGRRPDAGVGHLVVVTSALVYGAWPTNPVPLTDDAPLRPNPDFAPAVELGEVERLVGDWREAHPSATVAVLRPAVPVAEEGPGWLASMLAAVRGVPVGDDDPPAQFVHLDDLASAVAVAVAARPRGGRQRRARRVDRRRGAAGPGRRARGSGCRGTSARRSRRGGGGPACRRRRPGLLPWTVHPWVVSADRLKGGRLDGGPVNQEAFVAGHRRAVGDGVAEAAPGAHPRPVGRRDRRGRCGRPWRSSAAAGR